MRDGPLRRIGFALAVGVVAAACDRGGATSGGLPYLDDATFRRAELTTSLWSPQNEYSQLRLTHYATGDTNDWDLLPEWNPPVDVIAASELDTPGGASSTVMSADAAPLALPDEVSSEDDPSLLVLGEAAFRRYPVQVNPYLGVALASRAAAAGYGVWVDDTRGAGGLVRARMADGSGAVAVTCSTCHEATLGGVLTPGLSNASLNVGQAMLDAEYEPNATVAEAIALWGPGRLDVTTTVGTEPVRIADLRPVRWLSYLQADATVALHDRTALAIRLETLIITAHGQQLRPPRVVTLALAAYVASLADTLPKIGRAHV